MRVKLLVVSCCIAIASLDVRTTMARPLLDQDGASEPSAQMATDGLASEPVAPKVRRASRHVRAKEPESEKTSDLAGRYAVLRDKRDTGCMVTLDDGARVKGGDRAQLAPGCRDQGIVIFDPSAWMVVKGELVLTARAGHKAILEKRGEGLWAKDAKDGGKPLGLKKL